MPIVMPDGIDQTFKAPTYEFVDDLPPAEASADAGIADFETLLANVPFRAGVRGVADTLKPVATGVDKATTCVCSDELNKAETSLIFPDTSGTYPADKLITLQTILMANLANEISGCSPRYNGQGSLVLTGKRNGPLFNALLKEIQSKLMKCPSCYVSKSALYRESGTGATGTFLRVCQNCPARTYVDGLALKRPLKKGQN